MTAPLASTLGARLILARIDQDMTEAARLLDAHGPYECLVAVADVAHRLALLAGGDNFGARAVLYQMEQQATGGEPA